jgi:N-hydroxyarylamine O-acetyltransferase
MEQVPYDTQQVQRYLHRIGFPGFEQQPSSTPLPEPTVDTLVALHRHHCLTIPFENLSLVDPRLQGPVPIDHDSLYTKMVLQQRGGWCFEANGLLSGMLNSLGYDCYEDSARVVRQGTLVPPKDPFQGLVSSRNMGATFTMTARSHRVVLTQLGGQVYLCDAGFGGQGLLEPMLLQSYDEAQDLSSSSHGSAATTTAAAAAGPLAQPGVSQQAGTSYRLRRGIVGSAELLPSHLVPSHPELHSYVGWYLQCLLEGVWTDLYFFTMEASFLSDFEVQSFHVETKHSLFTKSYVVTMPTPTGRHTLVDYVFKIRAAGQATQERQLQGDAERDSVLREVFGIDVTAKAAGSGVPAGT